MEAAERRGHISGLTLKIVAIVTMFIDHAAKTAFGQRFLIESAGMQIGASWTLVNLLTDVGRIAFPLFAFLVAEGCRHTRSAKKYVFALFLFGLLSEVPFQLAFTGRVTFGLTNVFFTLALGALACTGSTKPGRFYGIMSYLPVLLAAVVAELLRTDYGALGVLLIAAAYIPRKRNIQMGCMALVITVIYMFWAPWSGSRLLWLDPGALWFYVRTWLFALLPLGLIALYNGQRGAQPAWLKWGFYVFYPAHLALLYFLSGVL